MMVTPTVVPDRPCGHPHHHGTCAACQRALLALHEAQLAAAANAQTAWHAAHPH